jgi:phage protein D
MANTYKLLLNGTPADDNLYTKLGSLEVEENADMPGAIQLELPVTSDGAGDLNFVTDSAFQPFANLAVVATPDGGSAQCIFDGYVLSHKLHLETGLVNGKLQVWGQDASWLMNLEEKAREWVDVTDSDVASSIFGDYGISPASENSDDDSPSHTEDTQSLMQRGSDIQFLRRLARANGKLCRVSCADQPGVRTGVFARPTLDSDPVVTFTLTDPSSWNIDTLDFEWDVSGPTAVKASQATFDSSDADGVSGDSQASGLTLLDQRDAAAFAGKDHTVMLSTPVDSAGELTMRAQALLAESGWFVRCEGEADVARLNAILRAGDVVQIDGVGALNSGKYMVWSVRHSIGQDSHKMKFVLVRNAVGAPPSGGGGLPGLP